MADRLFAHRLMGAQRNQNIKGFRNRAEVSMQSLKQKTDRGSPSAVRHDQQDAFSAGNSPQDRFLR